MRERHERCHGPYAEPDGRYRTVTVGADGARRSRVHASERAALDYVATIRRNAETRTLDVAVSAYVASQKKRVTEEELRTSTVEREEYHLRAMLKLDDNGSTDLRKLTTKLARRLYDERAGAVDTHRNGLSVCKAFGRWCAERGWLPADPFSAIKGRGRRRKGKPQLRIEESRKVIDTCVDLLANDDGAVCTLAYLLLGARSGEVVLSHVRDVDDGGRLFWIPDSKTEAGRRQIEVPAVLQPGLSRLAERRPADAPLFAHAATRARPQDWAREQVWRICKLAGVPEVTPHGLRGTQATLGRAAGATPELVAATLGHASTAITTGGAYIDKQQAAAADRKRSWRVLDGGKR
jgi:integrase